MRMTLSTTSTSTPSIMGPLSASFHPMRSPLLFFFLAPIASALGRESFAKERIGLSHLFRTEEIGVAPPRMITWQRLHCGTIDLGAFCTAGNKKVTLLQISELSTIPDRTAFTMEDVLRCFFQGTSTFLGGWREQAAELLHEREGVALPFT